MNIKNDSKNKLESYKQTCEYGNVLAIPENVSQYGVQKKHRRNTREKRFLEKYTKFDCFGPSEICPWSNWAYTQIIESYIYSIEVFSLQHFIGKYIYPYSSQNTRKLTKKIQTID